MPFHLLPLSSLIPWRAILPYLIGAAVLALVFWAGASWQKTKQAEREAEAFRETIERIQNAPDIDLSDRRERIVELCRLAGITDCPLPGDAD